MARALLIDDEAALTTIMARFLEGAGFEVQTATSGPEGLRKAVASPPDVAVVDVMMPDMDGYEVVRRLRRDPRTTRAAIAVLTARGQLIDKEIALRAGADIHMSKPYQGKLLVEELNRLLAARPEPEPPLGHQVTCLRLQEDAGATTLAANLALCLGHGGRLVAVADLVFEGGQIENHLGLPPTRRQPQRAGGGGEELAGCLVRHESGLFVLPAPPPGSEARGAADVRDSLRLLREWHDYVVVDTPFNLGALAPVLLSSSSTLLLVLAPDGTALRTAQASVAAIHKMGNRNLQVWPVINGLRPEQQAFRHQAEAALKMPVIACLPWSPDECAAALVNGRPVVVSYPESPLAGAVREVAARICQSVADQPLRRILR